MQDFNTKQRQGWLKTNQWFEDFIRQAVQSVGEDTLKELSKEERARLDKIKTGKRLS